MAQTEAQLFVGDMDAAIDFYRDRLGFALNFEYGDPAFYAQVELDGARLNLRHVDEPVVDEALREREELLSATIVVDDVDALFDAFDEAGMHFRQRLALQPWGSTTFIVADPDGNLICFAG